ncbi:hypothetical protein RBS60_11815 [Sinomonas sp. ASV486]|uniref:hypothetical protein n=1 Tax=Sinomonas sp. ASV486 TaxID=3051170 RepID=UPI0027DB54E9|nr:hypothetical protein [Sinomonas sp. ASV486]MDQ4490881.1 hypothetical protein [Sinomonas sp. ASV486]
MKALEATIEDQLARLGRAGLDDEDARFPPDVVRRGHVLSMAIFSGLSALAPQELAAGDSPELRARLAHRAGMARALMDAVDALG